MFYTPGHVTCPDQLLGKVESQWDIIGCSGHRATKRLNER